MYHIINRVIIVKKINNMSENNALRTPLLLIQGFIKRMYVKIAQYIIE